MHVLLTWRQAAAQDKQTGSSKQRFRLEIARDVEKSEVASVGLRFRDNGSRHFVLQRVLQGFKCSYNEVCQEKSYQKVLTKEVPTYGGEGRRKRIVNVTNTWKKTDDGAEVVRTGKFETRRSKRRTESRHLARAPTIKFLPESSYQKVPSRSSYIKCSYLRRRRPYKPNWECNRHIKKQMLGT